MVMKQHEPVIPQPSRSPQSVEVNIEELVLHGFAPSDRDRIGMAVEHELMRLFVERKLPSSMVQGGTIERLDGGQFHLTTDAKANTIGMHVAQTVYGGLSQGSKR
jgi:hypothetical protein